MKDVAMNTRIPPRPLRWFAPLAVLALAACAPAPIYKVAAGTLNVIPMQVAHSPEQFNHGDVIWGGSVINVRNFPDHSEIEMLAFPLDASQRPQTKLSAIGRFIAVFPGYIEPINYPGGSLVTVMGQLNGTRSDAVDQAPTCIRWSAWRNRTFGRLPKCAQAIRTSILAWVWASAFADRNQSGLTQRSCSTGN
jgi:outer membrane lipoprotein